MLGWSCGHKKPDFGAHCDHRIIFDAMNHVQGRIRNVKKCHCAMVDAVMYPLVLQVIENIRSGATSRLIFPDAYKEEFFRVMDECVVADECLRAMSIRTPPQSRYTPELRTLVAGSSPSFSRWCRDLYAYLLGAGKPGVGLHRAVVHRHPTAPIIPSLDGRPISESDRSHRDRQRLSQSGVLNRS